MLRSVAAVLGGFMLIGGLSFGADAVLRAVVPGAFGADGRVESVPVLFAIQGYVALFAITGCYLAARWAGRRPMLHALVLGLLGLVFNLAGAAALWETAPAWYHVLSIALVMPYAWIGGRLREQQVGSASPAPSTP